MLWGNEMFDKLSRSFHIVLTQLKEYGFKEVINSIKLALFRDEPMIIYLLEISQSDKIDPGISGKTNVQKGNLKELEEINKDIEHVPWEFQCHQYDGVKDFFIASDGKEIQHIIWIYYQNDPNRLVRLGPKDAEVKYGLTLPAFRGQGIYPMVLKTLLRYLKQKGFRRVYGFVHKDNHSSMRGIEKAGFRRVGRIRLRKVLGIQISRRYVPQDI
jgi:RimJ/RimL family protein N-acetyltransferase